MIRIGINGSDLSKNRAAVLVQKLQAISENSTIITVGSESQNSTLEEALISHDIDVAVSPLNELAINSNEELVIAGLSERTSPRDMLIIKATAEDAKGIFNLKSRIRAGVSSKRQQALLKHYINEITCEILDNRPVENIEKLELGQLDALMINETDLDYIDKNLSQYNCRSLNTIEFVPAPGQGVLAYRARKSDIATRKILHQIHQSDVSQLTNIERQTKSLFSDADPVLGVHCTKDANNYYHLYGFYLEEESSDPVFHRISQSTSHKLAERMFEALTNNNLKN